MTDESDAEILFRIEQIETQPATIDRQIVQAEKRLRDYMRKAPIAIRASRLKEETAAQTIAEMRAAIASLHWLAKNRDWIRQEAERRRKLEAAQRHPLVESMTEAGLPVDVVDVRDLRERATA